MIWKKCISFIIALIMAAGLLAGCGGAPQSSGAASETGVEAEAVAEADAGAAADAGAVAEAEASAESETGTESGADSQGYEKSDAEWNFPETGFILKVPESIKNMKGQIYVNDMGEISIGAGVFVCDFVYLARTDEETAEAEALFNSYNNENDPDGSKRNEVSTDYYSAGAIDLFFVMACEENEDFEDALAILGLDSYALSAFGELGQSGEYKYYYFAIDYSALDDEVRRVLTEDFYSEFEALHAEVDKISGGITLTEPRKQESGVEIGRKISFETKDLDGNTVTSEELFADSGVTMINIWATWCGPCKNELAELEKLNAELNLAGCKIIGICDDTLEGESVIAEAKSLLEERGVHYLNLQQTAEIKSQLPPLAFPTTYFVDSQGTILTEPVVGALFDQYRARLQEALGLVEGVE